MILRVNVRNESILRDSKGIRCISGKFSVFSCQLRKRKTRQTCFDCEKTKKIGKELTIIIRYEFWTYNLLIMTDRIPVYVRKE